MKKLLPIAAVTFLLAGCAAVKESSHVARDDTDYQKVYLVEKWARRSGVEVIWVNYPTKAQDSR